MAESVGSIYYEVDADTAKLLEKVPQVEKATDKLGKTFDKTGKAANDAEFKLRQTAAAASQLTKEVQAAQSPLGGLMKLLGGLVTLQGARTCHQLSHMAIAARWMPPKNASAVLS